MSGAEQLLAWLRRFESVAAAAAYTLVALLLIGDVLGRELFGTSLFGAQKMAVYAAIVAGFLGLSLATGSGSHLRPAFLDQLFPPRWVPQVLRLGDALSCTFYLALAWFAVQFVLASMQAGDRAAVLYWTLWPIQLVIPYALLSSAIQHGLFARWPALRPLT